MKKLVPAKKYFVACEWQISSDNSFHPVIWANAVANRIVFADRS